MPDQLLTALEASQQAEAELRAREERLHASLDAAAVGAWDWNIRTGEVRWSDNLERIHGRAPGEFRGTFESFLDGVHPEDRQRVLDAIQRSVISGEPYRIEYRSVGADREIKWFESRGHVFRDGTGGPEWMSGICMDVTGRHRFQEQLCETQRLESLGILAGGIAHDFNNLLGAMMGNAGLALDALPAFSPARPFVQRIVSACERAALLTRRVLAYAGKDASAVAPADLSALVRDLESLLHASIPKLVAISLDLEEDLPSVLADEAQLQQVIMNLVINAAEAIPAHTAGTVTIATGRRRLRPDDLQRAMVPLTEIASEYVELSVHDDGCGMDAATQARIFDPFFTTKFAGRGLGLSSVLGIVGAHRGTITLRSAPGEGSCFAVFLPAAPDSAQPKRAAEAQTASGSGTILIVDDEPAVREMSRCVLESGGYQVLVAADGLAAIQQVIEHPEIRAVLMDLAMPGMGGDTAASRVRELRPEMPILLSSGYSMSEADRSSPEGGYSAFLPKPYSPALLLDRIGRLLSS